MFHRPTPTNAYGEPVGPPTQMQSKAPPPSGGVAPGFPGVTQAGFDNLIGNPMVTGMAMQYGQDFMGRGGEEIKKNLDKYVSIGQLKYYFAVDTLYVAKKIGVLLFPFTRSDWAIKYNQVANISELFLA